MSFSIVQPVYEGDVSSSAVHAKEQLTIPVGTTVANQPIGPTGSIFLADDTDTVNIVRNGVWQPMTNGFVIGPDPSIAGTVAYFPDNTGTNLEFVVNSDVTNGQLVLTENITAMGFANNPGVNATDVLMIGQNNGGNGDGLSSCTIIGIDAATQMDNNNECIVLGTEALSAARGSNNLMALGNRAMRGVSANDDFDDNIAIGNDALARVGDSADRCLAIGRQSLSGLALAGSLTGNQNMAIGFRALGSMIGGGQNNIIIGPYAANNVSGMGTRNICIGGGTELGAPMTSETFNGDDNIVIGNLTFNNNGLTTASDNIVIGSQSFQGITTSGSNVAIGTLSGNSISSSSNSVIVGCNNCKDVTNADNFVVLGNQAVRNTDADAPVLDISESVYVGRLAGGNMAVGAGLGTNVDLSNNVVIGASAGLNMDDAQQNVIVGSSAATSCESSNNVLVGAGINVNGNTTGNNTLLGQACSIAETSIGNVIVGHLSSVAGAASSGNIVFGEQSSVSGSNNLILNASGAALNAGTSTSRLFLEGINLSADANAGAGEVSPSHVATYLPITIGGVTYKIPLYAD